MEIQRAVLVQLHKAAGRRHRPIVRNGDEVHLRFDPQTSKRPHQVGEKDECAGQHTDQDRRRLRQIPGDRLGEFVYPRGNRLVVEEDTMSQHRLPLVLTWRVVVWVCSQHIVDMVETGFPAWSDYRPDAISPCKYRGVAPVIVTDTTLPSAAPSPEKWTSLFCRVRPAWRPAFPLASSRLTSTSTVRPT